MNYYHIRLFSAGIKIDISKYTERSILISYIPMGCSILSIGLVRSGTEVFISFLTNEKLARA